MSDCRYPWERDPLNDPPHMKERFENNAEELARLRQLLDEAREIISEAYNEGHNQHARCVGACNCPFVLEVLRKWLSEYEKEGKGG